MLQHYPATQVSIKLRGPSDDELRIAPGGQIPRGTNEIMSRLTHPRITVAGTLTRTTLLALALAPSQARANATFNLIADPGTPQFAVDGFHAAAGLWSSVIANNVTFNIQIGYAPLDAGVIGQTTSSFIEASYATTRQALLARSTSADDISAYAHLQGSDSFSRLINLTSDSPHGGGSITPYLDTMNRVGITTANAKVLGLQPQDGSIDAVIRFSSDFSFDFEATGPVDSGAMDFIGVAAHEIGHALGFVSGVDDIDYFSGLYPAGDFSSNLIDLFRFSDLSLSMGAGVTDYAADERDKFFSTDGGATVLAFFANGTFYGDGNQASHWRDNMNLGLLDPTASYGERLSISELDRRMLDVLGYTIVPEPGVNGFIAVGLALFILRHRNR